MGNAPEMDMTPEAGPLTHTTTANLDDLLDAYCF